MIVERQDNSVLYFIVGGLLVAIMAFAFFYFRSNDRPDTMVERNTLVERTTEPAAGDSDSMSLSIGEDGASASTTRESTQ